MGRRCKGDSTPFPTFAAENGGRKKFSRPTQLGFYPELGILIVEVG